MRNINELIKNISGGGSSAHAYIIEGRPQAARREFTDRLAMGLECTAPDLSARPCGVCDSCRQVKAGTSLDIVRMQMSGKTSYKTEDAAAFMERLDMGAYGRYLIGIIDDADHLSEIVQNKLLKTLEEPHEQVILLLGTPNRDGLLSTVQSRCGGIRLADYVEASPEEHENEEAVRQAAGLMTAGAAFYEFRDAADKCLKTGEDALLLIDSLEDILREKMLGGIDPSAMAERIALAEEARADIARGMDKSKAVKRLFLDLQKPRRADGSYR